MRSADEIREDVAAADASETWSERYHDAIVRLLNDVEPLLAEVEMQRKQIATAVAVADHWACDHYGFDDVLAALSGNPRSET